MTESIRVYSAAERVLRQFPEVTNVVTKIGRAEVATDPVGVDGADVFVALKPHERDDALLRETARMFTPPSGSMPLAVASMSRTSAASQLSPKALLS